MSEEENVLPDAPEGTEPEQELQQESVEDSIEEQARGMGWRAKEEYNGDNWVPAEIFVARAPLIEKIEGMGKALKRSNADTAELKRHYEQMRKVEYDRAYKALKAERRAALADGDADALDTIETEMDTLRAEHAQVATPQVNNEFVEDFKEWKKENSWYGRNDEATEMADTLGMGYHNKGFTPDQVLEKVTKDIKKAFPELHRNPNRDKPSGTVAGSSTKGTATANKGSKALSSIEKSLSAEERQVMNKFIRSGILTKAEYLNDMLAIKEAENG